MVISEYTLHVCGHNYNNIKSKNMISMIIVYLKIFNTTQEIYIHCVPITWSDKVR